MTLSTCQISDDKAYVTGLWIGIILVSYYICISNYGVCLLSEYFINVCMILEHRNNYLPFPDVLLREDCLPKSLIWLVVSVKCGCHTALIFYFWLKKKRHTKGTEAIVMFDTLAWFKIYIYKIIVVHMHFWCVFPILLSWSKREEAFY